MSSYAIIQANGKQFWVEEDRFYNFDKLPLHPGDTFILNKILLLKTDDVLQIGKPFLGGQCEVKARVIRHLSGSKVRVYKMKSKKKTRKNFGSRKKITRVLVESILLNKERS